jgi:tetratricopeptide (TPR) repeat protein
MRAALDYLGRGEPPDPGALRRARLELAAILQARGNLDEAAKLAADTIAEYEGLEVPEPAGLAWATTTLGRIESAQGQLPAAVARLERAVELHRRAYGATSVPALEAKSALAFALVNKGESARAEILLREIVEDTRRIYGPAHIEVGIAISDLGNALSDFPEKFGEAEQAYVEAIRVLRASAGAEHPELASALNNAGFLYLRMQRWDDARAVYAESAAIRRASLGASHADTAAAEMGEALALNKLGAFAQAERLLRSAVATFAARVGPGHWRTANAETYLGIVLTNLRQWDEAESTLVAAERKLVQALGSEHYRTRAARTALQDLAAARRAPPSGSPGPAHPRPADGS